MPKLIFDEITHRCIGFLEGGDGAYHGPGILLEVEEVPPETGSLWLGDDGQIRQDVAALLEQAKTSRKARIKQEAARLIEALDWKLDRAREREAAGWATLAEVDAVLTERETIRRSSSAAEVALDALTDIGSVQNFAWAVDVPVATPRRLTHKGFSDRFTDAEMQAILTACQANAALNAWWEKFKLARDINLDDPATQGGVQALEIAGLIGEGRAAEVLA